MTSLHPTPDSADISFAHWFTAHRNLILTIAAIAAVFWTTFYLQFTVDDAFISFRYGQNLIAQHIWNWNTSGPREEAYTSALYTALSILPALLHISPALFFKLFGLLCIASMVYRLRTAATPFAFLLGLLLLALHPWVWLHAFAGLETPLYMLLLLELALAVDRAPATSATRVYTLFLLLPLTRPEGILFACIGVALFWHNRGPATKHYPAFALALTFGLLYFYARWRYFHHLLPNPFYFKLAHSNAYEIVTSLLQNLTESKGYFLTLLLIAAITRKLHTRIFALTAVLVLLLLYAPHDMHMNYADRFYFQLTLPFLLLFLITEDLVPVARIAAILATLCLFSITVPYLRDALDYFPLRTQADIDLAQRLAPFATNHTILTPNAGTIPYYSHWVAYDFFGLGTYRIAHDGLKLPLLQQLHPDLILVESTNPGPGVLHDPTYPAKQREIDYIQQSHDYDYIGESGTPEIYNVEFLRKDTPQHDQIVHALQENMRTSARSTVTLKDLLLQRYVRWKD